MNAGDADICAPVVLLRWTHIQATAKDGQYVEVGSYFFIVSVIAGLFGFTGIAAGAAGVAKVLFFLFVVLFVVFLVLGMTAAKKLTS